MTVEVATHNGVFHADDVFAVAVLDLVYNGCIRVTRTRDPKILSAADVVVDVGGEHSVTWSRFDHHQKGRAGSRSNGIFFSSFGLVWARYGESLCGPEIAKIVDRKLVCPIDATDNGQSLYTGGVAAFPGITSYSVSGVISSFNPNWNEPNADFDSAFLKAVGFAREILLREISSARGELLAREVVLAAIQKDDPLIVVLDRFCPWQKTVYDSKANVLFVVFPSETGTWMCQAVNTKIGSFDLRHSLPEKWAGLRDEEFCNATGISDGVFCHPGRFICGAKSRESAIKLARMALEG